MNPEIAEYILSMSCVSGDDVQVAIHRKEDIILWLRQLDHEGSSWCIVRHHWGPDGTVVQTDDLTDEYQNYGS